MDIKDFWKGCKRIFAAAIVLLVIYGVGYVVFLDYTNKEVVEVIVKDKTVKPKGEGNSIYLVFTDKEVYKIDDQWFFGKFNSSDIYSTIEIGHKYQIVSHGYRIPILSCYKNIRSVYKLD